MDQHQRIERLTAEARRLAGGDMKSFAIDNLPPHFAERFLQRVIAFETAPGDDDQATNYLTFYASERERQQWREDFPDVQVPPHRDPAHDRDAALPTPDA